DLIYPFTVVGPDHPITATVGKDIVLSCHLSPSTSAVNMEVRWYRSEFNSPVYLHRHGKDQYEQQMTDYQGRTELWKAALMDGDVFLTIVNIRPSDEGQYHCSVQEGDFYEEAVLELKVEASGSAPQISVEGHQDGGIRMVCHLAGWYPEPEVLWRDLRGQPLSSFTQTKSKDEHGLFEIKSSIIIRENSNKNIYCSIRKMNLNLEKEPSTLYISDSFFPRVSPWTVTWSVTLVILLVFISLTLFQFKLRDTSMRSAFTVEKRVAIALWKMATPDLTVTLDPDTAHPNVVLSADGKRVRRGHTRQHLPDNPARFDTERCVLGHAGFTSGRHYWEVEVEDGLYWAVGVARESVRRKGEISLSPEGGIWAVWRWGDQFQALTSPVTPLPQSRAPSRIRVCLDCDRGQVTFFGAGDEAPIFTFPSGSVSGERIRPWLRVGWYTDTRLRLCP
uniref:Butyrophilin subfamily 1 member A1 n=1 Tax=Pelusios castaneus TaxID=367368 RepID=A0A8C8SAF7_9SAUR